MATDLASLSIRVENGDVIKTTTSLNSMEVAGSKAEASTQRLTRRMALLEIQAREMDAQVAKNATTIGRLKGAMESAEKVVPGLTTALGALSAAAAIGFIGHKTLEETKAAQDAMAQLEAAVTSTGGAAGRTVAQLDELSIALQKQTTYSDEAVKGAEAILLTFNKIKGTEFDRATVAATNLATRFGKDLPEAALQVGKALQDPVEGLQALTRLGIRFSASQKQMIQDLVDTGHAAEAMDVILAELEKRFGGSAAAARDTLGGALKALSNAWGDLFEVTKSGTQGTVTGINAITTALENSGLSMNKILKDATVDWETMRASIEKVGAVSRLQLDTHFLENARNVIQRIDDDLTEKIHQLNKPAKVAPAGAPSPGGTTDLTETAQKFAALVAQRDAEIAKVAALNAAYRESAVTLALLSLQYDAQAKKSENAQGHTARETAILNSRTDALTRQKTAQILLNDELERSRKLQAARDQNTGEIEAALHASARADLSGPDAEIQAIRDRADEEAAAERRAHDKKQGLRADEQATENKMYNERVANIRSAADIEIGGIKRARQAATDLSIGTTVRDAEQQTAGIRAMIAAELEGGKAVEQMRVQLAGQDVVTRALNDAIANNTTVTDEQAASLRNTAEEYERVSIAAEKVRAIYQEVGGAVSQALSDIFDRKNPIPNLARRVRDEIIAAVSQPITAKITATIAHVVGLDQVLSKQEKAAKDMNTAADKMLRAAGEMNGADSADGSVADAGTVFNPQSTAFAKYAQQILGIGASAYGGYQAGYGIGASTQSQVKGAIGGAVSGAVTGAAVGGVPGAIVGGFAGLVGGLLGAADAAREAERALLAMQVEAHSAAQTFHTELTGDSLDRQIAGLRQQYFAVIKQLLDANGGQYPAGFATRSAVPRGNIVDDFNQAAEDYNNAIRHATEAYARSLTEETADYHARFLRATGHAAEADAEEFASKQRRERQQLVDSFGDYIDAQEQATLSAYDQAAAAEKVAQAFDSLTTSVRGGPSGLKLNGYIQQYATGLPHPASPPPFQWPTLPPIGFQPPSAPQLSQSNTGKVATGGLVIDVGGVQVTLSEKETPEQIARRAGDAVFREVLTRLDRVKNASGGINTTRAKALEIA